ncbi:hypothetical protein ACIBU0_03090 [Streptomyces sp. NPDC049627]|uniref:hypothetical protein n=1 Tax=Streptomyces sp. NPDC049627 TaxID=3365595 RepID=UPI003799760F
MPDETRGGRGYEAEDAALAQAGPAQSHADQVAAARSDVPSAEQADELKQLLDERERRFARRRKPMGPTSDQIPETVPEDAPPTSDEQPSTTPESHEP